MKSKLFVCLLALCLLLGCPVFAAAEEAADVSETVVTEESAPPSDPSDGAPSEETVPVSDRVVAFFADHLSELFCALTFLGSMILALVYKKGLLPLLRSGLSKVAGSLGEGMDTLKKTTDRLAEETDGGISALAEKVSPVLEAAQRAADHAEALASRLECLEAELGAAGEERSATRLLLRGQMEMFYEFFMSVNLPQYQKDKLGQTYVRLLAALEGEGGHA